MAKFMNKSLKEHQLIQLMEHLSFDHFVKNESINMEASKKLGFLEQDGQFMRKGNTRNSAP